MLKIAALSLAFLVQSWAFVTTSSDGTVFEYDPASREQVGEIVAAWVRYREPDGGMTISNDLFDCANKSSGTRRLVRYNAAGKPVGSLNYATRDVEMTMAVPGTVAYTVIIRVCAR